MLLRNTPYFENLFYTEYRHMPYNMGGIDGVYIFIGDCFIDRRIFHIWYFCRKSFRGERTAHDSRLYESRRCGLCTDEHIEKLVDPAIKYRWGGADFWTDYGCTIWTGCFFMDCFRGDFCRGSA